MTTIVTYLAIIALTIFIAPYVLAFTFSFCMLVWALYCDFVKDRRNILDKE